MTEPSRETAKPEAELHCKHEPARMPQVADGLVCRKCGEPVIEGTDEAWESRQLGADERYVKRASPEQEVAINRAAEPPLSAESILHKSADKLSTAIRSVVAKLGEGNG